MSPWFFFACFASLLFSSLFLSFSFCFVECCIGCRVSHLFFFSSKHILKSRLGLPALLNAYSSVCAAFDLSFRAPAYIYA